MVYFWIVAFILFLVVEAVTVGLVTLWFAFGSVVALIAAAAGAPAWFQYILFITISGLVLLFLRPMAVRFINSKRMPTNADRVIGMICPVTEPIDNIAGTGAVSVDGKVWTARSVDGRRLGAGTLVRPLSIQGVKLIVEEVKREREEPVEDMPRPSADPYSSFTFEDIQKTVEQKRAADRDPH